MSQELISSSCAQHLLERVVTIAPSEELMPDDNFGWHVKVWTGEIYGAQWNRADMFVKGVLS